jgi:sugar (pentulose or hexulose) kinase
MGGAIQALWVLEQQDDPKASIETLVDAHVAVEGGVTVNPDPASVAAYDKAYANYSRYLEALSPLYK